MEKESSVVALAWKILYDEELEHIPDPNKPENVPYLKAKKKQRANAFKALMEGNGKVLFEEWKNKVKRVNLAVLFTPKEQLCDCAACTAIREIRNILELWIDAEQALIEEKEQSK